MDSKIIDRCLTDILENGISLDQCLQNYPAERDELEPVLRVAVSLISAQRVSASAKFKRTSWIRIQNQILSRNSHQTLNTQAKLAVRKPGWLIKPQVARLVLISLLVLVFVTVGFSGLVAASASSLPGDWLYPAKLQVEQIQISLAQPGLENAALRLDLASRRLAEADQLIQQERSVKMDEVIESYKTQVKTVFDSIETDIEMSPEDRSIIFILLKDWYSTNKVHLDKILSSVPDLPFESVSQTNDFSRLTQDRVIKLFQQYPFLLYTLPEIDAEGSSDEPGLNEMSVITTTEIITPSIVNVGPTVSNGQGFKLPTKYLSDGIDEEFLLEKIIPLVSTYFPDEPLLLENLPNQLKIPHTPGKKDMEDFPGFDFPTDWPESFPDDFKEP